MLAPEGFDPKRFFKPPSTTPAQVPPPRPLRSVEQALAEVAEVMGVPVERVLERRLGRSANLPAWVAAHWLSVGAGLSQPEIAELLGVSRARVSQLQGLVRGRAREDVEVGRVLEVLEAGLVEKV